MSRLLLGFHMHQPTDNLHEAVERAVERCYEPLFTTLAKYPKVKFALHCSGWLLKQLRKHYPKTFEAIRYLHDQGSIEFFTGGFYEPVLASIPPEDRIAQIRMLSDTVHELFGAQPKGLWLTERVWESSVLPQLKECGIERIVVDDYHLIAAGFDKDRLDGYFLTEEGGERFEIFPIAKDLRYAIPFHPVADALAAIEKKELAIIFDDAEKFGLWPKTYEWVHEKGWLEEFLSALESSDIETIHFEDVDLRPRGLVYLPNVSYYEMGEWSLLPLDALELERLKERVGEEYFEQIGQKFIKGGIWKNFFIKYEESNRLHKRMLSISKKHKSKALYKLQTNDVYWHGIFGGLYLPNLRDNAYRYLAKCEQKRFQRPCVIHEDMDLDGYEESEVHTQDMVYRFYTRYGGQLIELLDNEAMFNFQNTLTRRYEAYHEKIFHPQEHRHHEAGIETIHTLEPKVEERIKELLYYDWYTKNSFIDHISDDSFDAKSLFRCDFKEYGDFANQPFERKGLTFERSGGIYQDECYAATLTKRYEIKKRRLGFEIDLLTQAPRTYRYALEWNLHFAAYEDLRFNEGAFQERFEGRSLRIDDPFTGRAITIELDQDAEWYLAKTYTVSQNEEGFEATLQGISIAAALPFSKSLKLRGALEIRHV